MLAAFRRLLLRLRNAIAPARAERELQREITSHVALLEDEFRRRGMSDDEARRAARHTIGGIESAKDRQRDARSFLWIDDLRQDAAYAIRTLRRSPGFALGAIFTLAISIGANTAIFSVVDHVLLRSLPLPNASRLVRLYESNPAQGEPRDAVAPARAADWRRATKTLDRITIIGGSRVTITGAAEPESLAVMLVGPEFFEVTGAPLTLGQPFPPSEYLSMANAALGPIAVPKSAPSEAAVIISHALWQRQFGGDPRVVGRVVLLNGSPAHVAGVMSADFRLDETPWGVSDCWLPFVETARLTTLRRFRQFIGVGRLAPGVGIEAARADMNAIAAGLAREHPADDTGWTVRVEPLQDSLVAETRPTLLILFGGVTCVLLIACANIANLLTMRAAGRSRETAVRMAIGAGRSRLVRQWLTESTLLALAGGAIGFAIAAWAVPALLTQSPLKLPRIDRVTVDARVFVFSMVISLVTGIVCGLAPALGSRDVTVASLRSAGVPMAGARHRWLRPLLVTGQIGIATMLLIGAGLVGRTLLAVYGLDLGFNPKNTLTFTVNLTGSTYHQLDAVRVFGQDLISRLRTMPGIEDAGMGAPPLTPNIGNEFEAEGHDGEIAAGMNVPGGDYFRSLGLRLRTGRFFTDADRSGAPPVAIVNHAFAQQVWGSDAVVGRRLRASQSDRWMTVVGVIDNLRVTTLEAGPPPTVFIPFLQSTIATMSTYIVRTSGDPNVAVPLVRAAVRELDPSMAVSRIQTMDERLASALAPREFNAWLVGFFSAIAVVLAIVGIYGLVAETVSNRTPEIGMRMALGASRPQIARLVIGGTALLGVVGLAIGVLAAAAATRSLESMLFGVKPLDPITLTAVPVVFLVVAILATVAPVRRATRIDPVVALRTD